jgi:hypothetical protein
MVATLVLGTSAERRVGSSPTWSTKHGAVSSVGRVAGLHPVCRRFESVTAHQLFYAVKYFLLFLIPIQPSFILDLTSTVKCVVFGDYF